MKHLFCLLLATTIVFSSCRHKEQGNSLFDSSTKVDQEYSSEEYAKNAIITGKVLNREFYPLEKELVLIIPFFKNMENTYRTQINEDGTFSFSFPVNAKIREVAIRNYAEHLYVHPGDSLHIEINFKDMFHPKVTGDAEKLNREILAFTESAYYYIRGYSIKYQLDYTEFESELEKEYKFRLERREEYLKKYKPMKDVVLFTEELLKQDYYYTLLQYAYHYQLKRGKEVERYHSLLPEINQLYNKGILSSRLFDIAEAVETYISYGIGFKTDKLPSTDVVMSAIGEDALNQYIYAKMIISSLGDNDTLVYSKEYARFDSIVTMSHLRTQVIQAYHNTRSYLENPQSVSDHLLYGMSRENLKSSMPYMESIYDIIEKNKGKVIYFDFWARWCPPCLAEMEPLKQLRSKYSMKDLAIYSICGHGPKNEWEECLEEYSLKNKGIECIFAPDYFGEDNYQKIRKQWNINRIPYYVLINRKGQVIDFGTAARPSNPTLLSRMDEAIKN